MLDDSIITMIDQFKMTGLEFAKRLYDKDHLDQHWINDIEGMGRPGYGQQETEAIALVLREAAHMGMDLYQDLAGNAYMIYAGSDRNKGTILIGSHLDAVPKGGRYDGTSGVIGALGSLKILHEAGLKPLQDICVAVWRCEESPAFRQFGVGSGIACQKFDQSILDKMGINGTTLEQCIKDSRFGDENQKQSDTKALRDKLGQPLLPFQHIAYAIETHIEQYSLLDNANSSIGVVNGIRGNIRYTDGIHFEGRAQHTGGGFMSDRADTSVMLAKFMGNVSSKLDALIQEGADLVYSFPVIKQENQNPTTTAKHSHVLFEARSLDNDVLHRVGDIISQTASEVALSHNGRYVIDQGKVTRTTPVTCTPSLQETFRSVLDELGISNKTVPSGAGHDIMNLPPEIPKSMLFTRHGRGGISHNPAEILGKNENEDPFSGNSDFAHCMVAVAHAMMGVASSAKRDSSAALSESKSPSNPTMDSNRTSNFGAGLVIAGARQLRVSQERILAL